METKTQIAQKVAAIYQELLTPLANLSSSYTLLKGKVPLQITEPINVIGKVTNELLQDIRKPFDQTQKEYDFTSPTKTLLKLHEKVSQWRKSTEVLSDALQQIQNMRNVQLGLTDPPLDTILNENLFNGFKQLTNILDYLETVEEDNLLRSM